MKLSREALKKIIKEELEEILGFGSKALPAHKNQQVLSAMSGVHRALGEIPDIFELGVAGDRYGLLKSDAHVILANFAKQKGLPILLNNIANLYQPLEILRKQIEASKDQDTINRFNDPKEGIHGRFWPLVMFLKTDAEQLKKFSNLSQLNKSEHAGSIKLPGLLSLIAAQAGMKENISTPVQERKTK